MEKLIELLNEYQKENWPEWISFYEKNWYLECQIEHYVSAYWYENDYRVDMEYWVEILISKYFWFIEWLVEKDKIDKKKLDEAERRPMYVTDDMFSLYKVDECVIMLLSISSSPIYDLISYLKEWK